MEIDGCESTSPSSQDNSGQLYVVQRCWHSGPAQYQPMDLMRLFVNQRDAEEAAYHSSHAWCRYHRPEAEPQVKTLLLPSYPIQSNAGSSYGFIAHGSLFWVRSLTPTILATGKNRFHQDSYVVVTEGVIGGTGNCVPGSRGKRPFL